MPKPLLVLLLNLFVLLLCAPPASARQPGPAPVQVEAFASRTAVRPGEQLAIAVVFDHQPGWHVHTHDPRIPDSWGGFEAIPTTVEADATGARAGPVQWPTPHAIEIDLMGTGTPEPYEVYEGRAIAYVPLVIDADVSGEVVVELRVVYQACDDTTCIAPESKSITLTLPVADGSPVRPDDFASFDFSIFASMSQWAGQPVADGGGGVRTTAGSAFFGLRVPRADGPLGIAIVALLAAAGGLVLNFTPCVLPVIPIKILTISRHAGAPGRSLVLGLWMALGVVAFWVAIGLPMAIVSTVADPSRLFGIWWVTLVIGLLIGAMGVGIMGAFTITLPQSVYMLNPKADSPAGSFLFGLMTAVLGLPCFGFVAGALLAGAATLPPAVIILIFTAIGLGMASPYLLLSAFPQLLDKLPRTGPASELIKQVMGLLLLAAAAYFVGSGALALLGASPSALASLPWWGKLAHWWVVAVFVAAAGLWLTWSTFRITNRPIRRGFFGLAGLLLAGAGVAYVADTTLKARASHWIPFDQTALEDAVERGSVVVVDFTAEWCLNCKALKSAVLNRDPVRAKLLSGGIVPMTADVTSNAAPGWDKLRELGQTGIPLLAVYGPGLPEPWLANAYTAPQVLDAIERASGPPRP